MTRRRGVVQQLNNVPECYPDDSGIIFANLERKALTVGGASGAMTGRVGCDLKKECGFYCRFAQSLDEIWQTMIRDYCDGPDFLLCARRSYFSITGRCAPADITPIGTLPDNLRQKISDSD